MTRHALRSLRRTPVFTVAAALTLVIGIAAAVAIFTVVDGVILRPLPYPNADRLIGAWHDLPPMSMRKVNQTASTYSTYKRLAKSIESIGAYQDGQVNVALPGSDGAAQRLGMAWITRELLPTLEVAPFMGRNFTEAEDAANGPEVVVISEGMWRARFGADPRVIGKTLSVGGTSREIIGVMPATFRFPDARTELWLPMRLDPTRFTGGFNYNAVARMRPGITVEDARRDFAAVLPQIVELYPNFVPGFPTAKLMEQAKPTPVLVPLKDDVVGGIARTLWMVAAAAALVLLVACANVTNLILVRADGRQRELAVREALGAGRARVMLHFLAESAALTALASIVALGVAWAALRALVSAGPVQIPRLAEVGITSASIAFLVLVAMFVTVVCSVIPALRIGRAQLSNALREGGRGGTSGKTQQRVRGALVAAQIAIALVVLAGSGVLLRSHRELQSVRPGFDAEGVATLWLSLPWAPPYNNDTAVVRFYGRLDERIRALPGVTAAAMSSRLPLLDRGINQTPIFPEDDPTTYANKVPPLQLYTTVDGDYFRAMGIPLLAGRTFESLESQRGGDAIISRSTAIAFWKDSTGRSAVGKRFYSLPDGPLYTVIGVVGDTRDSSLASPPAQVTYFPQAVGPNSDNPHTYNTMALVVKTQGDPASTARAVQRLVAELDPTLPTFDVKPMSAVLDASMAQLSFTMLLLGAAGLVTLLLGAIGLYGVMAYAVTLRTRELGVRIALGAQPAMVARMITRQGVLLTITGIAAGVVAFALVARVLDSFVYGVATTDPLTLAGAATLMLLVALAASWIPARRAAGSDPAVALRAE